MKIDQIDVESMFNLFFQFMQFVWAEIRRIHCAQMTTINQFRALSTKTNSTIYWPPLRNKRHSSSPTLYAMKPTIQLLLLCAILPSLVTVSHLNNQSVSRERIQNISKLSLFSFKKHIFGRFAIVDCVPARCVRLKTCVHIWTWLSLCRCEQYRLMQIHVFFEPTYAAQQTMARIEVLESIGAICSNIRQVASVSVRI